jgi:hypothetical protein
MLEMITALAVLADDLVKKLIPDWGQGKLDKMYELIRDVQNAESGGNPPDMNLLDYKREQLESYVKVYNDAIRAAIAAQPK